MTSPALGRRFLLAWPLLCVLATTPTLATQPGAPSASAKPPSSAPMGTPLSAEHRAAMLAFDATYIPALFLTGSAGKSAEGPAQARAAMARLLTQWPTHHMALQAAAPRKALWLRALAGVQQRLQEAEGLVAQGQWGRLARSAGACARTAVQRPPGPGPGLSAGPLHRLPRRHGAPGRRQGGGPPRHGSRLRTRQRLVAAHRNPPCGRHRLPLEPPPNSLSSMPPAWRKALH